MEPRAQIDPATQPSRLRPLVLAQLPDLRIDAPRQARPRPAAVAQPHPLRLSIDAPEPVRQEVPPVEPSSHRVDSPVAEYFTPPAAGRTPALRSESENRHRRHDPAHHQGRSAHALPHAIGSRSPSRNHTEEFSSPLYLLNQQIKQYAGLIVTLALVSSAALMYWMMGQSSTTTPEIESYSEAYGSNSFPLPPFPVEETPSSNPELPEEEWVPEQTPEQQSASRVAATIEPEPESAPCPLPPCDEDELRFPATNQPDSLDFTRLQHLPEGEVMPHALPPVAQLPGESSFKTTNR